MITPTAAAPGRSRRSVPHTWTSHRAWLGCAFGYAFFVPTFATYVGSTGAILVNGGLLVLVGLIVTRESLRIPFVALAERRLCLLMLTSLVYYLGAVCFSTAFLSETIILRDLFELHKPLLHAGSFVLPFVLIRSEADVKGLDRIMMGCLVGVVVIALLQFFGMPFVGELYTKQRNIRAHRVTAPFGNPYDFGFAMSLFLYLLLFRWVHERRAWQAVLGLLLAGLILFTQSRTAAITAILSLAIPFPLVLMAANADRLRRLHIPSSLLRYTLVAALASVAVLLVLQTYTDQLRYLIAGIGALLREGEQSSLTVRLEKLQIAFDSASTSVLVALFGNGVSKGVMQFLESLPTFFIFRYGLVGFLVIFVAPLVLMIIFLGRMIVHPGRRHSFREAATLVWYASLLVAAIGNSFTEQPRVSFLYYFMMGFVIRHYFLTNGAGHGQMASELSLLSFISSLFRRRRLVLGSVVAGVLAAVTVASLRAERYTAESTILLQNGAMDNLGTPLAFYGALLESSEFRREAVRANYGFPVNAGADTLEGTLVELYDPAGAADAERVAGVARQLEQAVRLEMNEAARLITLETAAPWPALAEQINARFIELLNDSIEARRRVRLRAHQAFLEGQLDRAYAELERSQQKMGVFLERNRHIDGSPALELEAQRLGRAVELREEAYISLASSSNWFALPADRNFAVVVPLDAPQGSARRQSSELPVRAGLAMVLGGVLSAAWIFARDRSARTKAAVQPGGTSPPAQDRV